MIAFHARLSPELGRIWIKINMIYRFRFRMFYVKTKWKRQKSYLFYQKVQKRHFFFVWLICGKFRVYHCLQGRRQEKNIY